MKKVFLSRHFGWGATGGAVSKIFPLLTIPIPEIRETLTTYFLTNKGYALMDVPIFMLFLFLVAILGGTVAYAKATDDTTKWRSFLIGFGVLSLLSALGNVAQAKAPTMNAGFMMGFAVTKAYAQTNIHAANTVVIEAAGELPKITYEPLPEEKAWSKLLRYVFSKTGDDFKSKSYAVIVNCGKEQEVRSKFYELYTTIPNLQIYECTAEPNTYLLAVDVLLSQKEAYEKIGKYKVVYGKDFEVVNINQYR